MNVKYDGYCRRSFLFLSEIQQRQVNGHSDDDTPSFGLSKSWMFGKVNGQKEARSSRSNPDGIWCIFAFMLKAVAHWPCKRLPRLRLAIIQSWGRQLRRSLLRVSAFSMFTVFSDRSQM